MQTKVGEKFREYYERWVSQLDEYLQQLLNLSKENFTTKVCLNNEEEEMVFMMQSLVSKVTQHYKEYYTVKWALAHEDVLPFFSSVWVSPLESACMWITGWKPSMVFKLLDPTRTALLLGPELDQEQKRKIQELKGKVKLEESKVEREMERQQVALADRKMVELARMLANGIKNIARAGSCETAAEDGQMDRLVEVAVKGVVVGLEKVMKAADCVRLRVLKGILDILNPSQRVSFLAGASMAQIQLRQMGNAMHEGYS